MSERDGKPLINIGKDDLALLPDKSSKYSTSSSTGSINNAITNNIYGINHRQSPGAIPMNRDQYGLTFFTRPQLNMRYENIINSRLLLPLLTDEVFSYHRIIRCLLDPRLMANYPDDPPLVCPLVDNKLPFIAILTNHLNTINGWQDILVPNFSAAEGAYKEGYSFVDGTTNNYASYDITATFRNSRGDPITSLFYYWGHYMSAVYEGKILPYPDYIISNTIDYNTRIYRLVLDQNKRYVQKIAATGASHPIAIPIGSSFDYSNEKPYNDANHDIAIPFRCLGAIYNDDILFYTFNKTVSIFNPSMVTKKGLTKVDPEHLDIFNNRGYPWIDVDTYELQWWVPTEMVTNRLEQYENFNTLMGLKRLEA